MSLVTGVGAFPDVGLCPAPYQLINNVNMKKKPKDMDNDWFPDSSFD